MAKTPLFDDGSFETFWQWYPRKTAKRDAHKAWATLNPTGDLLAQILAALAWQTQSAEWRKDHGRYVPYPASYIRGARWTDQPPRHVTRVLASDWWEDCKLLHHGTCAGRYQHELKARPA
jgi:hypothetical protein